MSRPLIFVVAAILYVVASLIFTALAMVLLPIILVGDAAESILSGAAEAVACIEDWAAK